jgi:GNAT superfamily N-acetyltransferase
VQAVVAGVESAARTGRTQPPVGTVFTGAVIVTTTYLQQLDPGDLEPARSPGRPAAIVRVDELSPEFARFLYTAVGGDWHWTDRLGWTLARWTEWLQRPGSETWVSWANGTPAGYVELAAEVHGDETHAEIAYFGLLPRFIGRGLGGQLLTEGIRSAWTLHDRFPELPPVRRVWVHSCTLDGPHALRNYLSRGFRISRTTEQDEHVPGTAPGPWPGADGDGR